MMRQQDGLQSVTGFALVAMWSAVTLLASPASGQISPYSPAGPGAGSAAEVSFDSTAGATTFAGGAAPGGYGQQPAFGQPYGIQPVQALAPAPGMTLSPPGGPTPPFANIQPGPPVATGPGFNPAPTGTNLADLLGSPSPYQPVSHSSIGAVPPGMNPWPAISPFEHGYAEHEIQEGLWTSEFRNLKRTYYLQTSAMLLEPRPPENFLFGGGNPALDNPAEPFRLVGADGGIFGDDVSRLADALIVPNFVGQTRSGERQLSFGLTWGWWEEDGSGVEFSGWHMPSTDYSFSRGIAPFLGQDPSESRVTYGLQLLDATSLTGETTVLYDRFFGVVLQSTGGGIGARYYLNPSYETRVIKLRGFAGVNYRYLRESFRFEGYDSGIAMFYNPDGTPIEATAVIVADTYRTAFQSEVTSHILGPELGLRFDVGGDKFKIFGDAALGVAMNSEDLQLTGVGIGDGFGNTAFDPLQTTTDFDSSTHISPTIDLSINAEMKIIGLIPVLKRMKLLEDAKLRVGYEFIGVSEVSRPYETIELRTQPSGQSRVRRSGRSLWYTSGFTFGFDWTF